MPTTQATPYPWRYSHDPFGIIPEDFSVPGQYRVTGFASPAGKTIKAMMAEVQYHGSKGSTTRAYLHVLYDYMRQARITDINDILYWRAPQEPDETTPSDTTNALPLVMGDKLTLYQREGTAELVSATVDMYVLKESNGQQYSVSRSIIDEAVQLGQMKLLNRKQTTKPMVATSASGDRIEVVATEQQLETLNDIVYKAIMMRDKTYTEVVDGVTITVSVRTP